MHLCFIKAKNTNTKTQFQNKTQIKNTIMKSAVYTKSEVSKKIMLYVSIVTCVVLAVNF